MSSGKSKIEWTQKTWNPTLGCTEVSPGCVHCYAARMAFRLSHIPAMADDYAGLTKKLPNGKIVWTGVVKELPSRLHEPLNIKKPTIWFVDSMSDLFHKDVSLEFIAKAFAVMYLSPQHTYQVLTKRAERMPEVFKDPKFWFYVHAYANMFHDEFIKPLEQELYFLAEVQSAFPLPNVWLGTSVENQKAADERIPFLLKVPSAVRFLSCEPLLGPVNLEEFLCDFELSLNSDKGNLHWVIVGGESGPGARPMHPDWARTLRDQCKDAHVPFFFKQWGQWHEVDRVGKNDLWGRVLNDGTFKKNNLLGDGALMMSVGKKNAGRLLDGQLHDEFPKPLNTDL